jgi:hypothetical protein
MILSESSITLSAETVICLVAQVRSGLGTTWLCTLSMKQVKNEEKQYSAQVLQKQRFFNGGNAA